MHVYVRTTYVSLSLCQKQHQCSWANLIRTSRRAIRSGLHPTRMQISSAYDITPLLCQSMSWTTIKASPHGQTSFLMLLYLHFHVLESGTFHVYDWGSDQSRIELIGSCLYPLDIWQQILAAIRFSALFHATTTTQNRLKASKLYKFVCQVSH